MMSNIIDQFWLNKPTKPVGAVLLMAPVSSSWVMKLDQTSCYGTILKTFSLGPSSGVIRRGPQSLLPQLHLGDIHDD